jgi:hypothetical protein
MITALLTALIFLLSRDHGGELAHMYIWLASKTGMFLVQVLLLLRDFAMNNSRFFSCRFCFIQ